MPPSHSAVGGTATPVSRVVRRWLLDSRPVPGAGEEDTAARCDRLTDAVESLGKLPAQHWPDVIGKLSVLAARLREATSVADQEAILTVLLMESVRDDMLRLTVADQPR